MKLCECGCGEPTPIARKTRSELGHVKGQPVRYINGHSAPGWKPKPKATHCRNGHEYTPENTGISKQGCRICRTCQRSANNKSKKTCSRREWDRRQAQKRLAQPLRFDHMRDYHCPAVHPELRITCELKLPHDGLHAARDDDRDIVVAWDQSGAKIERSTRQLHKVS